MKLIVRVSINGPKENIWKVITDIESSVNTIKGIEKIEVLENPAQGFIGFKWRETRTLFGKTATEVMWITEAVENEYYKTRAESHGSIYETTLRITPEGDGSVLSMEFNGMAQTFMAKFFSIVMGFMFVSATKKALQEDLNDIKAAVENQG